VVSTGAVIDAGGQSGAQGELLGALGDLLRINSRVARAEDDTTTTPDGGTLAAHTSIAGALLIPELLAGAGDFRAVFGVGIALTAIGAVGDHGVVQRLGAFVALGELNVGLLGGVDWREWLRT
jgi:hypothetical protein